MFRPLGRLEQDIMDLLWKKGDGSVRDIFGEIEKKKPIAYTTVLTVMNRLTEKGCLKRKMLHGAFVYTPLQTQEKFLQGVLKGFVASLSKNFGKEIVVRQFVESLESLDPAVAKKLFQAVKKK